MDWTEESVGRKFIAVVPAGLSENADLKQLIGKLKRTTSDRGQDVRWTPPDLWHVTLVFLGDVEDLGKLTDWFLGWNPAVVGEISLRVHGLGAFPSVEEARVLWLGIGESQEFLNLQREAAAQFSLSDHEFKPHLTLARFRNTRNAADLVKLGGRKHFGDYAVGELVLFDSVLQGNVLKYVPMLRKKI